MLARTDGNPTLVLHFGMTGLLVCGHPDEPAGPHDGILFTVGDGRRLRYRDQRKLQGLCSPTTPASIGHCTTRAHGTAPHLPGERPTEAERCRLYTHIPRTLPGRRRPGPAARPPAHRPPRRPRAGPPAVVPPLPAGSWCPAKRRGMSPVRVRDFPSWVSWKMEREEEDGRLGDKESAGPLSQRASAPTTWVYRPRSQATRAETFRRTPVQPSARFLGVKTDVRCR
ncbi:DNA-formamidopyrimidine glycosylase family protein [Streptomyces lavendulocolor]|uniref:DNA-formamidopyrimidine glycosylase family protein n=1 Tax=Streptomyces lavendulocolor TaxID=67316 RepID=UPI003C2BE802